MALYNDELHDSYFSPNIITAIKPRKMRWAGLVVRIAETRTALKEQDVRLRAGFKLALRKQDVRLRPGFKLAPRTQDVRFRAGFKMALRT
jgi:hypothetical protein